MVGVFSLKLDDHLNEDCYRYLLRKAGEASRKKFLEYRNHDDAYRSLFAEFLVRYVAIQRMEVSNDELNIRYSSYGKPYFAGIENFHFNLSHSRDWVVCAISNCPVGIDIEQIAPLDLRIMASYLSIKEQASLYRQKAETQPSYFYELWTLKE
ncbi:MAG: 4-phosphopantetheinyl transferase, partial [Daejeonella sp.]|nr:4-phosphopantetheinyl transferase [Daejeonella sp.]